MEYAIARQSRGSAGFLDFRAHWRIFRLAADPGSVPVARGRRSGKTFPFPLPMLYHFGCDEDEDEDEYRYWISLREVVGEERIVG